jgi:enoyl-CoA hydratase/carnithine racemase
MWDLRKEESMSYEAIIVEQKVEDKIGIITMNRPNVRNAINPIMREELMHAFVSLGTDPEVRAIILTGGPKIFAAGADLASMVEKMSRSKWKKPQNQ